MPKREVSIDECLIGCVRIETQQFNICPINIIRILVSRWYRLHSKFFNLWREKWHNQWVWNIPWSVYPTYGTFARYGVSFVYRQLVYCSSTCWIIIIRRQHPYWYCTSKSKVFTQGVSQKLSKGDSIAYRKEKLVYIGWQDKKHVILLSTKGSSKMMNHTSQKQILDCYYQKALHLGCCSSPRSASASERNREHQCPEIVHNYSLHMGGADLSDMRCYMFLDKRRTIRWNK